MNFIFKIIFASILISSVSGDLFDPCFLKRNETKTWCLGVKDNNSFLEKGTGCFMNKDCDAIVYAAVDPSIDGIKWTVAGYDEKPFQVTFSLTHSPYTRKGREDTVSIFCTKTASDLKSFLGFHRKNKGSEDLLVVEAQDSYRLSQKPRAEVILRKWYIVCEYISKTRIFYKNTALKHDYNIDLVSQKVYPNLILIADNKRPQLGQTFKQIPILVYTGLTPPPSSSSIRSSPTHSKGSNPVTGKSGKNLTIWVILSLMVFVVIVVIAITLIVILIPSKKQEEKKQKVQIKSSCYDLDEESTSTASGSIGMKGKKSAVPGSNIKKENKAKVPGSNLEKDGKFPVAGSNIKKGATQASEAPGSKQRKEMKPMQASRGTGTLLF